MKYFAFIAIFLIVILIATMVLIERRILQLDYPESKYIITIGENKYNLIKPKQRWNMPYSLKELSGICLLNERTMLCIQDESGVLYVYDLVEESVKRKIIFGKPGDYEDVAVANNTVFVLNSNGNLFSFPLSANEEAEVTKIKTALTTRNDTEGLAYDAENKRLLIACKNEPLIDKKEEKGRAVYTFKLTENKLVEIPSFFILKNNYLDALQKHQLNKKAHNPFQPSGLAIHPFSGKTAVICSVGKIMILLDKEGNIETLAPLDPTLFLQPEGICFAPNGDLYIASEGRDGQGYILKF